MGPNYARMGDIAHGLTLISALFFAYAVVIRDAPWFDEQWKQDGFCVSKADEPFWTSHDMCLYVDTLASITLGLLYYAWHASPDMSNANQLVFANIPGIFAHGLGHGGLAAALRDDTVDVSNNQITGWEFIRENGNISSLIPLVAFWMGMSYASLPNVRFSFIPVIAMATTLITLCTQYAHNFTIVQTVLFLLFSINQLLRNDKDHWAYAVFPILVGLPLTLVGWMESLACQTLVRDSLYGHVAYDAYIPASIMVFYSWSYMRSGSKKAKTA